MSEHKIIINTRKEIKEYYFKLYDNNRVINNLNPMIESDNKILDLLNKKNETILNNIAYLNRRIEDYYHN